MTIVAMPRSEVRDLSHRAVLHVGWSVGYVMVGWAIADPVRTQDRFLPPLPKRVHRFGVPLPCPPRPRSLPGAGSTPRIRQVGVVIRRLTSEHYKDLAYEEQRL